MKLDIMQRLDSLLNPYASYLFPHPGMSDCCSLACHASAQIKVGGEMQSANDRVCFQF